MFKTKTKTSWSKTKTFIIVVEVPRDQDSDLEYYITGLYAGLSCKLHKNTEMRYMQDRPV